MAASPSRGPPCAVCEKFDHTAFDCSKKKGCGKCKSYQNHTALDCTVRKSWPSYDQQVCDCCMSADHELRDCEASEGTLGHKCTICGHDHRKGLCPFGGHGGKKLVVSAQDLLLEQFTKFYRQRTIEKLQNSTEGGSSQVAGSAGLIPPTSTSSNTEPATGGTSHDGTATNSTGMIQGTATSVPSSNHILRVGKMLISWTQKDHWDAAEKAMPGHDVSEKAATDNLVSANFFEMKLNSKNKPLFKYSITLGNIRPIPSTTTAPSASSASTTQAFVERLTRETKRYLIEELLRAHPPILTHWATDYSKTIISVGELFRDFNTIGQRYLTPHNRTPPGQNQIPIPVYSHLTCLGEVNSAKLDGHVTLIQFSNNLEPELQALNIISWKEINGPNFDGGRVGNKFYLKKHNKQYILEDMKAHFSIRQGFFSSMRPGRGSILMNVNTTTSAFLSPLRVDRWMKYLREETKALEPKDYLQYLKNALATLDCHGETSRKWRIIGIGQPDPNNSAKNIMRIDQAFFKPSPHAVPISVYHHLRHQYPASANTFNPAATPINVGTHIDPIYYPADNLHIIDWQIVSKLLPAKSSKTLLDRATRTPFKNRGLIMHEGLQELGLQTPTGLGWTAANSFYAAFGITPKNTFVQVGTSKARTPKLLFGINDVVPAFNGEWDFRGKQFKKKPTNALTHLHIINFDSELAISNDMTFQFRQLLLNLGVITNDITQTAVDVDKGQYDTDEKALDACLKMFQTSQSNQAVALIMVVLEKRGTSMYSKIKRWGDCVVGIPTVCITTPKFLKLRNGTKLLQNLSVKFQLKLQGVTHSLEPPSLPSKGGPSGSYPSTMIVGADCTHPGDGNWGCPSIAGVVATTDDSSFQYLASARLQPPKEEYISDLKSMMQERYKAWVDKAKNARMAGPAPKGKSHPELFPAHIIFYRDGVSESQYGMVLHQEKKQIIDGCLAAYRENIPNAKNAKVLPTRLTLIVVTKRHHARFFEKTLLPITPNLSAGTSVDSVVVNPKHVNFYLQSHASALGTARSAHYIVLFDEPIKGKKKGFTIKELEEITNNLCYSGARALKANSVCTLARYADYLCDRLRCYMKPDLDGEVRLTTATGIAVPTVWADDPRIWRTAHSKLPNPVRQNPWHTNLDNVMFYL